MLIYTGNQDKEITFILVPILFVHSGGDENMCDWNNNGKYDMEDAFINYHIHKSMSGNQSDSNITSEDVNAVLTVVGIGLLILGILMIVL